jgi:hypothetical protein
MRVTHDKTDNTSDWTQERLDQAIAAGQFAPGTTLADIVLPSDWNADHVVEDVAIADVAGLQDALDAKQATLVSGTNIKTINGASVLGSGDLVVSSSAAWGGITGTLSDQTDLQTALDAKVDEGAVTSSGLTMATARLLGRSTASTGAIEEISIGSGLSLSGGSLSATGGGGGAAEDFPAGYGLVNPTYKTVASALALGDNDLYTVPSGKRVLVLSSLLYNSSGTNVAVYPEAKIGGSYQRLDRNATAFASSQANIASTPFVYEAGEVVALNAAAAVAGAQLSLIEFDDTSKLRTVRKSSSWTTGDDTIFTATGKTLITGNATSSWPALYPLGCVTVINTSGGSINYTLKYTPSGGAAQQITPANAAANLNRAQLLVGAGMSTGDSLVIVSGSSGSGQFAYVSVVEY